MEKKIRVNGVEISYFEEGEGFPFLIIHGWGPWLTTPPYGKLRELLVSRGYRVIFLCLPGFGESSMPSSGWGMDEYLKYTLSFINQMNLEKFFLLGHSFGGALGVELAASYPERIKALILLAPGLFRPIRFLGINVARARIITVGFFGFWMVVKIVEFFLSLFLTIIKKLGLFCIRLFIFRKDRHWLKNKLERAFKKVGKWLGRWDPVDQFFFQRKKAMSKILQNVIRTENTLPYLSEVKCPALIIWGEKDRFVFTLCARFFGRIPNHVFKIIPGAGHNPQEDTPEKLTELITDFIKKL